MRVESYDVAVIGSGSAGRAVAQASAAAGLRTVVIDKRDPGGTCALRGCDPKAFLIDIANAVRRARAYRGSGVHAPGLAVDWHAAMTAKRQLIGGRPAAVADALATAGIDLVRGVARFDGPDRIAVDGGAHLRCEHIVLDCGARARPLDLPGADLAVTSEGFLDLDLLPRRMVTIGGGYIGMEFGCLAAAAGVEVTVVAPGARPLHQFAPDLVDRLVAGWQGAGLGICAGCRVAGIAGPLAGEAGKQLHVQLDDGRELPTDLVLHAGGRVPNTAELDAARGEVGLTDGGAVVVDPLTMRSPTNHRVWALGDCAASRRPQLTPVAGREAEMVIAGILGGDGPKIVDEAIPTVAFTMPALARVGLRPADAPDAELVDLDLGDATWIRSRGEVAAGLQLVIDRSADRLLGAHVLAPHAEELINTFALAMTVGLPASRLAEVLPAYPSLGAITLGAAAR